MLALARLTKPRQTGAAHGCADSAVGHLQGVGNLRAALSLGQHMTEAYEITLAPGSTAQLLSALSLASHRPLRSLKNSSRKFAAFQMARASIWRSRLGSRFA